MSAPVDAIRSFLRGEPDEGEDAIRVWVEDASHVPPGFVAHRQAGLHYFDIPLDEEIVAKAEAPKDYWDMAPVDTSKAWVPYRGPMGGEGYINTDTGDVRYADQIPDDQEPQGAMSDSERRALNAVDDEDPEQVAGAIEELVGDELDMTAEELTDAAATGTNPDPGPEKIARRAVQELMGKVGHATRRSYTEDTTEAMTRLTTGLQAMGEDADEKAWVPYTGPRGGEGWQNPATGRVEYAERPPGSVIDPDSVDNETLSADIDRQLSDRGMVVRPDGDVLDIEEEKVVGTDLAGETVMGEVKDIETAEDGEVYLVVLDEDGFSHHVRPDEATPASELPDEKLEAEGGPASGPGAPSRVGVKAWMPYEGPEGGSGWQNSETGDVVYQEDPPGQVVDPDSVSDEVYEEFADRYDTTPDRIRGVFEDAAAERTDPLALTPDERDRVTEVLGTPDEDQEWEERMRENPDADPVETAVEVAAGADEDAPPPGEQYPEVSQNLLEVAEDLVAEGECEDMEGVNDGYCRYVAEEAYERSGLPDDVEILENGNRSSHHFIEYDGQYYDAEAPEGVEDWRDLPFFERTATPEWEPDVVTPEDEKAEAKAWVPYEGPEGGEGWRNTDSGKVIYQDEAPGGTPEGIPDSIEEIQSAIQSGDLSVDDLMEAAGGDERGGLDNARPLPGPVRIDLGGDRPTVSDPDEFSSRENQRTVLATLRGEYDGETVERVDSVMDYWDAYGYDDPATVPIWAAAVEVGGGSVPNKIKSAFDYFESHGELDTGALGDIDNPNELVDAIKDYSAICRDNVKKEHGETITVKRGVTTEVWNEYVEENEDGSVTIQPNAMESWTTDDEMAENYGYATLEMEFPTDNVMFDSRMTLDSHGHDYEEMTMGGHGEYTVPADQVNTRDDDRKTAPRRKADDDPPPVPMEDLNWIRDATGDEDEKRLDDAYHRPTQEVLDEEPTTNTLALKERVPVESVHDAPRGAVVHADPDGGLYYEEDAADEKQWVPYQGPQGGEGWRNLVTDEVAYQEEPPGETIPEDELWDVLGRAGLGQDEIQNIIDAAGLADQDETWEELVEEADLGDRVRIDSPPHEGGYVEGELVFNDGDWVEIEMDNGRLLEFEAEDLSEIVESADEAGPSAIREGYGSYNPDPPDVDPVEYVDALIKAENKGMVPSGTVSEYNERRREGRGPVEAFRSVGVLAFDEQHEIMKDAEREARLRGNSAPDHLDPTNAEEIVDLQDASTSTGISASAMDVAEMPDGSEVYVTYVGERATGGRGDSVEGTDAAEAAVATERAMKAMGVDVPDHHYEHNRFYAVEGVEGKEVAEVEDDPDNRVTNPDQAAEALAAGILAGNRDQHTHNSKVVDGKLVPIDLDLSAKDASSWSPGSSAFRKAGRSLIASGGARDVVFEDDDDYMALQKAQEHLEYKAMEMADGLDPDEVVEDVPDEDMAETIRSNIEHFAERYEEEWG